MVMYLCVFLTIAILIAALAADLSDNGNCFFGLFGGLVIGVLLYVAIEEKNPSVKPIDVYRGRTTLEITYRDSVAIDSTVVWKDE